MRRSRALILGACALLVAGVALAGVYKHGLNRYSTSEGVSRLASGYTHFQADNLTALSAKQAKTSINVANADTSDYIWYAPGKARHGEILRYSKFHVAQWKALFYGNNTAQDGPCTLFAFCPGVTAQVDSGKIYVCSDTLIYPFNGLSIGNSGASGDLSELEFLSLTVCSMVVAPQESLAAATFIAVGDTF